MNIEEQQLAEISSCLPLIRNQLTTIIRSHKLYSCEPSRTLKIWHDNAESWMYLPDAIQDRIQGIILMTEDFFEKENLDKVSQYIPENAVICDIGANIGNHSLFFIKHCQAAKVISLEPQKRLAEIGERIRELNNITPIQWEIINKGCGRECGRMIMNKFNIGNMGASQMSHSAKGGFEVVSIDSLELDRVDFLKIDVERMAGYVIEGAHNTIKRHKPIMWIELYDQEMEHARPLLAELGYNYSINLTKADFVFFHDNDAS